MDRNQSSATVTDCIISYKCSAVVRVKLSYLTAQGVCGYVGCCRHWRCREASVEKEVCVACCSSPTFSEKKRFECRGAVASGGAKFRYGLPLIYMHVKVFCMRGAYVSYESFSLVCSHSNFPTVLSMQVLLCLAMCG